MALTRSNLRQLAFALEFAPLASSNPPSTRCCWSSISRVERYHQRRSQSSRAWNKAPVADRPAHVHEKVSSSSKIIRDLTAKGDESKAGPTSDNPEFKKAASRTAALARLQQILADAQIPLKRDRAPTEKEILTCLQLCYSLAQAFKENISSQDSTSPVMKLLFLVKDDTRDGLDGAREQALAIQEEAIDRIADTSHKIMVDPKVYLTEPILKLYVAFRGYLKRPGDLAEIFHLYANKPVPNPGSSPVEYKPATPDRAASAVPLEIAQAALDLALETKDLPLSLNIIENTVATKAFRHRKFIQQALLPTFGLAATPLAAFALASQYAVFQQHMTTASAQLVGFAGITSYIVFTGIIGFVALTTSNDQMKRVTWAGGMPLRERWIREPERAMWDQVACAWGLKSTYRWGEEEGAEWNALKELVSIRGMVLDRVELMEGMQ